MNLKKMLWVQLLIVFMIAVPLSSFGYWCDVEFDDTESPEHDPSGGGFKYSWIFFDQGAITANVYVEIIHDVDTGYWASSWARAEIYLPCPDNSLAAATAYLGYRKTYGDWDDDDVGWFQVDYSSINQSAQIEGRCGGEAIVSDSGGASVVITAYADYSQ